MIGLLANRTSLAVGHDHGGTLAYWPVSLGNKLGLGALLVVYISLAMVTGTKLVLVLVL